MPTDFPPVNIWWTMILHENIVSPMSYKLYCISIIWDFSWIQVFKGFSFWYFWTQEYSIFVTVKELTMPQPHKLYLSPAMIPAGIIFPDFLNLIPITTVSTPADTIHKKAMKEKVQSWHLLSISKAGWIFILTQRGPVILWIIWYPKGSVCRHTSKEESSD